MRIQSPQDINYLRQLLASGAISESDLNDMTMSGSFGDQPQNALAQLVNPPQKQPVLDPAPDFPSAPPALPSSQDLRKQGQQFVRNEDTGQTIFMQPQTSQAAPQMPQQAQQKLGDRVEVPGMGVGRYSADGRSVVFPNGQVKDLFPQATAAAAKAAFDRAKAEAELAGKQASTAKTMEDITDTRANRAAMGGDIPQALLEKRFGKAPEGKRWNPQGQLEDIPGAGPGKLTEFQGKSEAFGTRAAAAHEILNAVGQNGQVQPGYIKRSLEAIPFVGSALGTLANASQSPEQQRVEQAQRDFVNATLRQESGAVISPSEFDNAAKQYFPQPGDSPAVVEQKRQNRERVIASFVDSAGPGGAKVLQSGAKARASFAEALPLPTSKAALIPGKTYRTARGPAVWNGTNFEN